MNHCDGCESIRARAAASRAAGGNRIAGQESEGTAFIIKGEPGRFLGALFCALLLLFLCVWYVYGQTGGPVFYGRYLAAFIWLAPAAWLARHIGLRDTGRFSHGAVPGGMRRSDIVLLCALLLFLVSGAARHPYFFMVNWLEDGIHQLTARSGFVRFVLLVALMFPVFLLRKMSAERLMFALFALGQLICFAMFINATGGEALWRDDHPSFLFRFWEFGRTFPQMWNYNPFWNGGHGEYIIPATGVTALGVPFWPLWRFFPVEKVYTPVLALTFTVLIPWVAYFSLRTMKAGKTAAACAGILSLGVSQYNFLWLLKFGTVPSLVSLFFVLPVAACLYRVIFLDGREKWLAVFLVAGSWFLLQWPAAAIPAAVMVLSVFASARRLNRRKLLFLGICAVAVLILHAKTLAALVMFAGGTVQYTLGQYTDGAPVARESVSLFPDGLRLFSMLIMQTHPVVLFLGIAGVVTLTGFASGFFIPAIAILLLAASWGPGWLPKLQLERMVIPAVFLAVIPAAQNTARIFAVPCNRRTSWMKAGLFALLTVACWQTARFYANTGTYQYVSKPPQLDELAGIIRQHTPDNGRVMFAGRTVHFFWGGHVAFLPVVTGREMMACDYYHFSPDLVEYDYPPRPFRQTPADMLSFMNIYDVGCIVTYHRSWREFFLSRPEDYEHVATGKVGDGYYFVFRVRRQASRFLEGSGTVKATFNRFAVTLDDPFEKAVIKYNWEDNLSVEAPATLFPFDAGYGVRLIGIDPAGRDEIHIAFRSRI